MSVFDKMKQAGAKAVQKRDNVFLERDAKKRKQAFGVELYDLMEELDLNKEMSDAEKQAKIKSVFDAASKDIRAAAEARARTKRTEEEKVITFTSEGDKKADEQPAKGDATQNDEGDATQNDEAKDTKESEVAKGETSSGDDATANDETAEDGATKPVTTTV